MRNLEQDSIILKNFIIITKLLFLLCNYYVCNYYECSYYSEYWKSNFIIYLYVGALFHWCGCCRVYFNDNAGRDYPSSSCDCRRFSAIRESQKERLL